MSGKRGVITLIVGTIAALVVTAFVGFMLTSGTSLNDVGATCEIAEAPEVVAVLDGGDSLAVAGGGQMDVATKATTCVLDELDAPESVRTKVFDTSAIQGRQSDSFDGWQVSWTYQPAAGLLLLVEKE